MRLGGKQVDADAFEHEPLAVPGRGLLAGGSNDPATDLGRDGRFGERVDEGGRRDQPALRVPPAQERLGADHGVVGEPDLRLKIEL
jgi:hypothetical protein